MYSTGQWALKAPAYQLWSAGLRYQLPGNSSFSHTFAVNVNNAFNRQYFKAGSSAATRLRGEDRGIFFIYTINHKGAKFHRLSLLQRPPTPKPSPTNRPRTLGSNPGLIPFVSPPRKHPRVRPAAPISPTP